MTSKNNSRKRHLYKTITWRIIATTDTFLISLLITGKAEWAASIASLEVITKMFLYYAHERVWFKNVRLYSDRSRHLYKTITWRIIATTDTFLISLLITGKAEWAASIASLEAITKMLLYYTHERVWFKYISIGR